MSLKDTWKELYNPAETWSEDFKSFRKDKEGFLLKKIKEQLAEVKEKPCYIVLDRNAYSILYKYINYKTTDFKIMGINYRISDDKDIDYFKFE